MAIAIRKVYQELANIAFNCSRNDWDGDGAEAISSAILLSAFRFLEKLTTNQMPDIDPESDGEICFTWQKNKNNVFSISIGANDRVAYAGIFDDREFRGKEHIINREIPRNLEEYINHMVYIQCRK